MKNAIFKKVCKLGVKLNIKEHIINRATAHIFGENMTGSEFRFS